MPPKFFTKRQALKFVREELGVPIGERQFERADGIRPDAKYGNSHLYTPESVRAQVEARVKLFEPEAA
jgi:hypothetical protein